MTNNEKTAYIDAELCLMSKPAKLGVEGAVNRWDELDWAHIAQANVIHNVVCEFFGVGLVDDELLLTRITGRFPALASLLHESS